MKAIVMTAPGGPETLELREIAEPGIQLPSQIKVRVRAAGVNPIDTKLRTRGVFYPDALPAVLGCDAAGEVVAVGRDVTRFVPGDHVWFCHGGLGADQGNYAEWNVLDERWAAKMPSGLDFTTAAAGPLVLITAWGALFDRGRLLAGQQALIHAGGGGVGHVAIQLAKWRGATVHTTASSAQSQALAASCGADSIINHASSDVVSEIQKLTAGHGVDLSLDTVGGDVFAESVRCTRHFGDLVTLLDAEPAALQEARMRNLRIGFELMLTPMLRALDSARDHHIHILDQCASLIHAGQLRLHVSHVLPLEAAAEAHRMIETQRTTGKLVLSL
ncbi:MAG: hypothetical protein RIQ52_1910 [Pseudomonadota bacterium]|jgi:NADPH2:quinone reductase